MRMCSGISYGVMADQSEGGTYTLEGGLIDYLNLISSAHNTVSMSFLLTAVSLYAAEPKKAEM